jgi:hypothetical protein
LPYPKIFLKNGGQDSNLNRFSKQKREDIWALLPERHDGLPQLRHRRQLIEQDVEVIARGAVDARPVILQLAGRHADGRAFLNRFHDALSRCFGEWLDDSAGARMRKIHRIQFEVGLFRRCVAVGFSSSDLFRPHL